MPHRPYPNVDRALRHTHRQRRDGILSHYNRLSKLQPDEDATITIQSALDRQGYVMIPSARYSLR